ncbi:SGNH/GDSL hydrolase family protein [Rhodococcoides fascians]|uniref:SGNH/GDSL hydrolase family protein n=1 Tax=Rhodococcoides fascians TaxID=1828 RepID=UPI00056D77BC|nr:MULTISPECIES: SGNH/GDSL hydrolase family protein [Rhodococcus]OZF03292.1 SGNH hydrolase [Rhodococcus sp. 15-1189-1-1a]OZF17095.1 SGNH hydrolase [Rhodococcus sp. 14-2686-1-2]
MPTIDTYIALGDSFTEGVGDPDPSSPNGVRGWADRVAAELGAHNPNFRYANLAVRGKLLDQVIEDQVGTAIDVAPDLVTVYAGGNDLMRPKVDIDGIIERYDAALAGLKSTGARVLAFTAYDAGWSPIFRSLRGRTAIYNELLREVADNRGVELIDYWRFDGYDDPRMWDWDRLHMSTRGHTRMAAEVLDFLGVEHSISLPALDPLPPVEKAIQRRENAEWVKSFAAPWVSRRLRGASSGDDISPKHTAPQPITV